MVCWLFVGSFLFSAVFAYLGGHEVIRDFVVALNLNPITFMLMAQVIIFLLGWPLEWTEIIIIFVPIFLPLLEHFGIDPLFFGLLIALNIQTSFLRSEEHTSELQSLMRISYAVFCLKKKINTTNHK